MTSIPAYRGVATGWTGVDTSTSLLPEFVPGIKLCKSGEFLLRDGEQLCNGYGSVGFPSKSLGLQVVLIYF